MSYSQAVREQILKARNDLGWSQDKLAEKAGLTQVAISRIETTTRKIDIEELVAIATALGLNAGDFLPNSSGLILNEFKPLLEMLRRMNPLVCSRTLRIVEQIVGIESDLQSKSTTAGGGGSSGEEPEPLARGLGR